MKDNNNITVEKQQGELQRNLGFWSLVFFGVIIMSPMAPMTYYPITQTWSNGFTYLGYVIALILIMLTVRSYQIMVQKFPVTGSAYTYASKGINGKVGFVVGWVLLIDYVLVPMFVLKISSMYLANIFVGVPEWIFTIVFGAVVLISSCIGIKFSVTLQICVGLYVVFLVLFFDVEALMETFQTGRMLFDPAVVYDSGEIAWGGVFNVAALGIVSFVGFDGITTLAEESKCTPKRMGHSLMVAVLISGALFIGTTFMMSACYSWKDIPAEDFDTAYLFMFRIFTSPAVANTLLVINKLATIGVLIGSVTSSSRILFSMGRNGVIPKKFFGYLHPKFNTPTKGVILVSLLAIFGALVFDWAIISEIVSYGACVGFIAVNLSIIGYFWIKKKERKVVSYLIVPAIAAIGILVVMTTLSKICLIVGTVWAILGIIYLVVNYKRSQEFRDNIDGGDIEM